MASKVPIKRVVAATALPKAKVSHPGPPQLKYSPGALAERCRKLESSVFRSDNLKGIASLVGNARKYGIQISPFSQLYNFTSEEAYQIAAEVCFQRTEGKAGFQRCFPIGRKIGFTNKNIWPEYNISGPIWGYMYNTTVMMNRRPDHRPFSMYNSTQEPKIEPEIVFGMKKTPRKSMSDVQLLNCVDWIGHGFEVVDSLFPGWKFDGNDTITAGALHRCLLIDRRQSKDLSVVQNQTELLKQLEDFRINLYCNGALMDTGRGSNVLGSPIVALRFLVELLDEQGVHPEIQPGEIITTGTLTRALPISENDEWHTEIKGIDLPGYRTRFNFITPTPQMRFESLPNQRPSYYHFLDKT